MLAPVGWTPAHSVLQAVPNYINRSLSTMASGDVATGEGDGLRTTDTSHLQEPVAKGCIAKGGSRGWRGVGVDSLGQSLRE
jgi:hypothetical protein